jgi:hypothetical protein
MPCPSRSAAEFADRVTLKLRLSTGYVKQGLDTTVPAHGDVWFASLILEMVLHNACNLASPKAFRFPRSGSRDHAITVTRSP